jgi:uncharacterized damage-inducible protein DinB
MDLLDRLLGHDAWTTRQLLVLCRNLPSGQLDHEFDIGHRTVRATLHHIIGNMEEWSAQIAERREGGQAVRPDDQSIDRLIERLDRAAPQLARTAHQVAARNGWDERWADTLAKPAVQLTYGGTIAHVITHRCTIVRRCCTCFVAWGSRSCPRGTC